MWSIIGGAAKNQNISVLTLLAHTNVMKQGIPNKYRVTKIAVESYTI